MEMLLTVSLWLTLALVVRLALALRELRQVRAGRDELIDMNKSLLDESWRRGRVIEALREDVRTWREVAARLHAEARVFLDRMAS